MVAFWLKVAVLKVLLPAKLLLIEALERKLAVCMEQPPVTSPACWNSSSLMEHEYIP